jgi:hypothetical protein
VVAGTVTREGGHQPLDLLGQPGPALPIGVPVSSIGVALDLHVLAKRLVADGAAFVQQLPQPPQDKTVALDKPWNGGLLEPDTTPPDGAAGPGVPTAS